MVNGKKRKATTFSKKKPSKFKIHCPLIMRNRTTIEISWRIISSFFPCIIPKDYTRRNTTLTRVSERLSKNTQIKSNKTSQIFKSK